MLEVDIFKISQIVEQFKSTLPLGGIQYIHGEGDFFRFACGENEDIAIYEKPPLGTSCIYNDTFPKTIDRSIVYGETAIEQLQLDLAKVYVKNTKGVLNGK